MTYNVIGGTLNLTHFNSTKLTQANVKLVTMKL